MYRPMIFDVFKYRFPKMISIGHQTALR